MDRKEAIEVVKKNYPHVETSGSAFETALRELVPELAESEDEMIRKKTIGLIESYIYSNSLYSEDAKECLAWLEKQKEQKPIPALDRGDEIILKAICEELKDAPGWVERIEGWYSLAKDAQHPAECSDCKEYDLGFERGREEGVTAGYNKAMKEMEQKEQKPAEWSEEDEKMIERIIRHTQEELDELCNDRYGHQEIISDLKESCRERMNWLENKLKSIRSVTKPKPTDDIETETHSLQEWAKIMAERPELRAEFDKMCPPQLIQGSIAPEADLDELIKQEMVKVYETYTRPDYIEENKTEAAYDFDMHIARHFAEWERKRTLDKVVEWMKANLTYIHPRKGVETCMVNIPAFLDTMNE